MDIICYENRVYYDCDLKDQPCCTCFNGLNFQPIEEKDGIDGNCD